MTFVFNHRASDASSMTEAIWQTRSVGGGAFTSAAATQMEMVVTRQTGHTTITMRGPETQARLAPIPEDADFLGIILTFGTYFQPLPTAVLLNGGINLPDASAKSFWLNGSAWEFPTYDNADVFISRLIRQGLLVHEPLVEAAWRGETHDLSLRSVQRRFLRATGLTYKTAQQIERAKQAAALLGQGVSILDTVYATGYFDQSHLTNALRHYRGQTPTQLVKQRPAE